MDRRIDERYSLLTLAKVTTLDQPTRERDFLLSEVSATGLKLIGQEQLPVGTHIGLDLNNHLLLAEVRYSYMRGTSSITGAQNLRIAPKGIENGSSRGFAALESEFQEHGSCGEIDLVSVFPSLKSAIAKPAAPPISAAAVLQSIFDEQREQLDAIPKKVKTELGSAEAWDDTSVAVSESEWAEAATEPAEFALEHDAPAEMAVTGEPVEQIEYSSPRLESSSRLIRTIVILGLLVAVGIAFYLLNPDRGAVNPATQTSKQVPDAPATQSDVSESAPQTSGRPEAAEKPQIPPAKISESKTPPAPISNVTTGAGVSATHHATLRVTAQNWVSACADGKPIFVRMLAAGEEHSFDFADRMVLRTGNAGSAHIDVNGKSVGDVGPSGGVRLIELTPAGFRVLNSRSPAKDCDVR